jgi:glycosyltransferase involved in cell wall biosynthesis
VTDVLVIAGEPTWPAISGGRVRVAGIVAALSRELRVTVVEPYWDGEETPEHGATPIGVQRIGIPGARRPGALRHFADWRPRLGLDVLDAAGRRRLLRIVDDVAPRVVLYGQSYVAAAAPPLQLPWVTDFQNVESQRLGSIAAAASGIHRASALWESLKAKYWERRVARQCTFALAVSLEEAELISAWGADVVLIPNAPPAVEPCDRSPEHGTVLFVANVLYEPNEQAARRLIEEIWPRVRALVADAELCVVGTGTDERLARLRGDGLSIVGHAPDLRSYYEGAALVVAPVESGGGTQLKVVEALAHGRIVAGSSYSARSVPPQADAGLVVADDEKELAQSVADLLKNRAERHRREAQLVAAMAGTTGWDVACRPLLERLRSLLGR